MYAHFILTKQRDSEVIPAWFIHLPSQSSTLPAESLVINDRAVVSTQAGWATCATTHFSPPLSKCWLRHGEMRWAIKGKPGLSSRPNPALSNQPRSPWASSRRRGTERRFDPLAEQRFCVPVERLIQYENRDAKGHRGLVLSSRHLGLEISLNTASVASGEIQFTWKSACQEEKWLQVSFRSLLFSLVTSQTLEQKTEDRWERSAGWHTHRWAG